MGRTRVAALSDVVPGRGLRVCVGGIPIAIYRIGDDFYAMEDTCPHAGSALSEGTLSGTVITCPSHGYDYDVRTGFRPDFEDGFPIPRFPVHIADDQIWIDIELPESDS